MDFKRRFAIQKTNEERIKKICPSMPHASGIYRFYRVDEFGITRSYVGQAKDLLRRCASHLEGYSQHIDLSIKKYGLYGDNNVYGYKVEVIETCDERFLDVREQGYILFYMNKGDQMPYNKTMGSQGKGKTSSDINEQGKGYYDGIEQGKKKILKEIKTLFDKYLDYSIKGDTNKIKEKKLKEFEELLDI